MIVDSLAYYDYGYSSSGMMDNMCNNDTIIEHNEYFGSYQYVCGRSFVEICRDMGLDHIQTNISY